MIRLTPSIRSRLAAAILLMAGSGLRAAEAAAPITPAQRDQSAPQVLRSVRVDESRPMRDIVRERAATPIERSASFRVVPNIFPETPLDEVSLAARVAARLGVQRAPTGTPAPATIVSFDGAAGIDSGDFIPPDTNGDASPAHFIQWVNIRWSIYNKITGARIAGPTDGNAFWSGFGGPCESRNDGDPIALWDDRAQRWIMSQFLVEAPFAQCFAISTTADPLGTYHRYEFALPILGDYPHLGVWTDAEASQNAYLLVTHDFIGSGFEGSSYIALERDRMLAGQPARMIRFAGFETAFGALPVHLEGPEHAPAGACPVFLHFDASSSAYLAWDLCVRWDEPALSTVSARPRQLAARVPFVANLTEVAQPGAGATLSTFGRHLMYRATGRAFARHAPTPMSVVVNHYVEGANDNGGIKWATFNFSGDMVSADALFANGFEPQIGRAMNKAIKDEGTYAPDASSRWLGAIAIDRSGNIGLGYSVGSASMSPELRITGREASDAPGTLRDEQQCSPTGTGSQLDTSGRWGDYASMSVDPSDECTFWFTSEYYAVTSARDWNTRICSFKFPGCGLPTFDLIAESPTRLEVCGSPTPLDPTVALRIGVLDGFTAPVTLSASGHPAGVTPQFSPTIVNPTPGTGRLTLAGASALASGEYGLTVTATSGAAVRTLPISFGVSASAAAAPPLLTPLANAAGIKIRPTLVWSAVAGALDYRVEVATDANFSDVVASATLTGTAWEVSVLLQPSTQYFWRVVPRNYCGAGAVSLVRFFTTGVPGQCPAGTTASVVFEDTFENGTNGWLVETMGLYPWLLQTAPPDIGLSTTVWRVANNALTSDQGLVSPEFAIPANSQSVILSFDAYHSFELGSVPPGCWDGAALEARSTSIRQWEYQGAHRIFTNVYNGRLLPEAPLAGRDVWCRVPTGDTAQRTIVDLDRFAGQTIQLRFRATTDSNTVALPTISNGLSIDNLRVEACQ